MTNIKLLVLSILGALFLSSVSNAGIGDYASGIKAAKLSIYGHTGQDPVAKSILDKDDFFIPTKATPKLDFEVLHEIPNSIAGQLAMEMDIDPFSSDTYLEAPLQINVNESILNHDNPISANSGFTGATVPAPPAFLILIGSLFSKSRRKP